MVASAEPAFNRANHVLNPKGALHHRDILPTEIGPGAARRVFDAGERDIDIGPGKIVDLDHGIAFDALQNAEASGVDGGQPLEPWLRLLQARCQAKQQRVVGVACDELHAAGQAVGAPVQWQRHGR